MARNRIIYQSLALYAGQPTGANGVAAMHTGAGTIKQLSRVQSWDSDFSRNFTDINQYGQLAAIDRIEVEAPTVNMSTSWYPTDGSNERYIGLSVPGIGSPSTPALLSGILKKETDEKNYFLTVASEGSDMVGYSNTKTGVFAVGNCFLTSYSLEASVGSVPTASADFEALNFAVHSQASGTSQVPAINAASGTKITGSYFKLPAAQQNDNVDQVSVLRPGDITFNLGSDQVKGFDSNDIKIQSFTLSTDLGRTPIEKLGSRFPFSREIDFPITASLSVEAQMGDLADFNLSDLLCETGSYNLSITMKKNDCSGNGGQAMVIGLSGAKLLSENVTTSIGDNASVTLEYEASIGGPEDLTKGVFISGSYTKAPELKNTTASFASGIVGSYPLTIESYPPMDFGATGYPAVRFGNLPAGLVYSSGLASVTGVVNTTGVFTSTFTGVNPSSMTGIQSVTITVL